MEIINNNQTRSSLIIFLVTLLLASILSFGAPNMLRTLAAAPIAICFALLGLQFLLRTIARSHHRTIALSWLLLFSGVEVSRYLDWCRRDDVWSDFSGREFQVAEIIRHLQENETVAAFEGWREHDTFTFLTHGRAIQGIPMAGPIPPARHVFLLTDLAPQRSLAGNLHAAGATGTFLREPNGRPYAAHLVTTDAR